MTDKHHDAPNPLRSTLAYLERESARRAKGSHPGMTRLADDELAALLELLRREVGTVPADQHEVVQADQRKHL